MRVYQLKHGNHRVYVEDDSSRDSDYVYMREGRDTNPYLITKEYLDLYYKRIS